MIIVFFLSCVRKSRTSTSPTNVSKLHDDVVLFISVIKSEYDTYSFPIRDLIVGKDPDTLNPFDMRAFFRVCGSSISISTISLNPSEYSYHDDDEH